ncbi:hypothetical protein HY479_01195 [Candidatus Uhrbacteria bacterium]|nr:hypothetical protein [Candidatus Uhrbacteria bacterium]
MIIVLRLLPFAVALLQGAVFVQQIRYPLQYPWIVALGVVALPLASATMGFRRVPFRDMLEKMTPSFALLAALAFGLLLAETAVAYAVIVALAVLSSFLSLELLFILAFDPSRYPVSALSRVNIAYVPIAIWYTAATSSGLLTFLHIPKLWHVVMIVALSAVMFRTTGHPGATWQQNAVWTALGALIGLHVGLLGLFLPLGMPVQGFIAAAILCSALRVRRYMYDPKPTVRLAWGEGVAVLVAAVAVLTTAKWL